MPVTAPAGRAKTLPDPRVPSAVGAKTQPDTCVAYVLSYRAPDYIRTRSLLDALHACPGIRVVSARNTRPGLWRYFETWRALMRIRATENPDVYVLGFRGHEIFWLVRHVARGKPIIFDALMSPYASLRDEGGGWLGRLLAPFVHRVERHALLHSDAVLTDTRSHAEYFSRTFGVPPKRIVDVPVGAVEAVPVEAAATTAPETFSALFYGSFLPLHGIDVIVAAAARLTDLPIRFDFIGGRARHARRLRRLCARAGVTRYTYRRWVAFEQLLTAEIPAASVCLGGPFGGTPQACRVITGKTSQGLASGKATVVGKIEGGPNFVDHANCLLVEQGDPVSLSNALRWAHENRSALPGIGRRGRLLYEECLSVRVVAARLTDLLRHVAPRDRSQRP